MSSVGPQIPPPPPVLLPPTPVRPPPRPPQLLPTLKTRSKSIHSAPTPPLTGRKPGNAPRPSPSPSPAPLRGMMPTLVGPKNSKVPPPPPPPSIEKGK